jgi:phosphohistidine swiveling domain-containing protein
VPPSVAAALRERRDALGEDPVLAVRSSALGEDGGQASFAGQYESVLGVRGEEALLAAIATVWRSFFRAGALAARAAAGQRDDAMAVLVQRMVAAECAGVAFSVDPVRQRGDLVVIDAAWGLGVGAVDGSVATDTIWLRRNRQGPEDQRVVEKPEQIVLAAAGGVERVPVPEERRRAVVLPEGRRGRVADLALAAEAALGARQDVEWAIADERLWLLQSRPITGLAPELRSVAPFPVAWESDVERRQSWQLDGASRRAPIKPFQRDLMQVGQLIDRGIAFWRGERRVSRARVINGRGYWTFDPTGMGEGDQRVRGAAAGDLAARLRAAGVTPWAHYAPEVIKATERLRDFDRAGADGPKLAEHLEDAIGAHTRHWLIHWMMVELEEKAGEPFNAALEKVCGQPKEQAHELGARLLEGEETVLTRLIDDLHRLGATARAVPALASLVAEVGGATVGDLPTGTAAVRRRLEAMPEAAPFVASLDAFLAEHGERVGIGYGSDAWSETPTWREDLPTVLGLVAPYLDAELDAPSTRRERARAERDAELERLCAACPDAEAVAELRRQLPYARLLATDLEEHNQYIDQLSFGQLRAAVQTAAERLAAAGVIADREDVPWLRVDEILSALRAERPGSLVDAVAARKREHAEWAMLEPPPILGAPDPSLDKRRDYRDEVTPGNPEGATCLRGLAASAGRRGGRARVVQMGVPLPAVEPGEVLVAENAGPQWTPLFPILAGVVLDAGVLTQHAATTAREYGLPAVIRTMCATSRIKDGDWVVVDGTAGTVELG